MDVSNCQDCSREVAVVSCALKQQALQFFIVEQKAVEARHCDHRAAELETKADLKRSFNTVKPSTMVALCAGLHWKNPSRTPCETPG